MNNTILDDEWYLIYYEEDEYKAFIKNHCPCEMGNEIVYIDIYNHASYANAMKFRTAMDAQLKINYLANQYSWFEKEKHKVVYCKVSVDIFEEKES